MDLGVLGTYNSVNPKLVSPDVYTEYTYNECDKISDRYTSS